VQDTFSHGDWDNDADPYYYHFGTGVEGFGWEIVTIGPVVGALPVGPSGAWVDNWATRDAAIRHATRDATQNYLIEFMENAKALGGPCKCE
jgi:hypothetical protein